MGVPIHARTSGWEISDASDTPKPIPTPRPHDNLRSRHPQSPQVDSVSYPARPRVGQETPRRSTTIGAHSRESSSGLTRQQELQHDNLRGRTSRHAAEHNSSYSDRHIRSDERPLARSSVNNKRSGRGGPQDQGQILEPHMRGCEPGFVSAPYPRPLQKTSLSHRDIPPSPSSREIRLRIGRDSPVTLRLNGEMEGRSIRVEPGEDGCNELVISGRAASESSLSDKEDYTQGSLRRQERRFGVFYPTLPSIDRSLPDPRTRPSLRASSSVSASPSPRQASLDRIEHRQALRRPASYALGSKTGSSRPSPSRRSAVIPQEFHSYERDYLSKSGWEPLPEHLMSQRNSKARQVDDEPANGMGNRLRAMLKDLI